MAANSNQEKNYDNILVQIHFSVKTIPSTIMHSIIMTDLRQQKTIKNQFNFKTKITDLYYTPVFKTMR